MGLDVYVGPLVRYYRHDWETIVQQVMRAAGHDVQILRTHPDPADAEDDPAVIAEGVREWQQALLEQLGGTQAWDDEGGLPYWTDKPDWDGYGGLVLLAAYDEQPELRDQPRRGLLGRKRPDDPREYQKSPAYRRAAEHPTKYPSLLTGVEWWLPVDTPDAPFDGPTPTGHPLHLARVDVLVDELTRLAGALGMSDEQLDHIRQAGPPHDQTDIAATGHFGLAIFLKLARIAQEHRQPLLLDY